MPKKNITPATLLLVCYSLVVQCSRYRAHGGKVWSHLPCNAPVMISIYPPRFSSMQCMQRGVESNAWAGSSDVLVGCVGANQPLDIASSANHTLQRIPQIRLSSDNISEHRSGATSILQCLKLFHSHNVWTTLCLCAIIDAGLKKLG